MKLRNIWALTAACLLAYGCSPKADQGTSTPHVEASQAVDSQQIITVTRQGDPDGRTLVLIPGLASSPDVWTETAAALPTYDLRLIQIAGFAGLEPADLGEEKLTDLAAKAIKDHLEQNPGRDVVIMGHSLGGFTALKTAMLDDRVTELIIVDSLPYLAEMMMPGVPEENVASMAGMMAAQMKSLPKASFDQQQEVSVTRLSKSKDHHARIINSAKASDQAAVADAMGELLAADLRGDLDKISAETLILAAWDPAMGVARAYIETLYNNQYAKLPNHQVKIVPDSFHFIMYDQFDAYMNLVSAALE